MSDSKYSYDSLSNSRDIENVLISFIEERFLVSFSDGSVGRDTDLFDAGIIDSFGLIDMLTHFQSAFGIEFSTEDLMSPQLATIAGLVSLFEGKRRPS